MFEHASIPSAVQIATDTEAHMAAYVTCALYDGCAFLLWQIVEIINAMFMVTLSDMKHITWCTASKGF